MQSMYHLTAFSSLAFQSLTPFHHPFIRTIHPTPPVVQPIPLPFTLNPPLEPSLLSSYSLFSLSFLHTFICIHVLYNLKYKAYYILTPHTNTKTQKQLKLKTTQIQKTKS